MSLCVCVCAHVRASAQVREPVHKSGSGCVRAKRLLLLTRLAALAPQLHNAGQSFQFWLVIEIASSAFNLVVVAIWVVICILHCDILESLMESHSTHSAHVCTHSNAVTQMHASTRGCTRTTRRPGCSESYTCCPHARARSKQTNQKTPARNAWKDRIPKHRGLLAMGT